MHARIARSINVRRLLFGSASAVVDSAFAKRQTPGCGQTYASQASPVRSATCLVDRTSEKSSAMIAAADNMECPIFKAAVPAEIQLSILSGPSSQQSPASPKECLQSCNYFSNYIFTGLWLVPYLSTVVTFLPTTFVNRPGQQKPRKLFVKYQMLNLRNLCLRQSCP